MTVYLIMDPTILLAIDNEISSNDVLDEATNRLQRC